MGHWWNDNWHGQTAVLGEKLATLSTTNPIHIVLGANPVLRNENTETNRRSYDTAAQFS